MNNKITISGKVAGKPEFSNESYGRKFYSFELESERTSGVVDKVHCLVDGELVEKIKNKVKLIGEIRSKKYTYKGVSRLLVYVYVTDVQEYETDENSVQLTGVINLPPMLRKTPYEKTIADIFLRTYRNTNSRQYDRIPVIAWREYAKEVSKLPTGTIIKVSGRLQSREYTKIFEDETFERRTVIEVSARDIEMEEL